MARRLMCCGGRRRCATTTTTVIATLLLTNVLLFLAYVALSDRALLWLGYTTQEEYRFFQQNYHLQLRIGSHGSSELSNNVDVSGQAVTSSPSAATTTAICHLPLHVSPFDRSVTPFLTELDPEVTCSQQSTFRPLTFVDAAGTLRQNRTTDHCRYRRLRKHPTNDAELAETSWKQLHPTAGLPLANISDPENGLENYVSVECGSGDEYANLHHWFNPVAAEKLPATSRKLPSTTTTTAQLPSVIILVIESLSRLNYLRYLKQTRTALEQTLGNTYYLEGLNKMADNSFPNMVPLLTGRRLYAGELWGDEDYGPYDRWPFVWKNFSEAGYLTALQEDYPRFTLFNYESRGFEQNAPTDFYPRPYWLALFSDVYRVVSTLFPFNISPCFRSRVPKVDVFLGQLADMIRAARAAVRPLFAFSFYIELTHNDFNRAQTIDAHVARFLRDSAHALNDSILILMGDHGNRFGPILQTTVGRIEERMPLFAVHLPEKLSRRYPHLGRNLARNRRTLTTWLDVHRMLVDVAQANFTDLSPFQEGEPEVEPRRAYSPWRETIPVSRICAQALVPELYCACDRRRELDQRDAHAQSAAAELVRHLNEKLGTTTTTTITTETGVETKNRKIGATNNLCFELTLNQTLRAELIFPSDSTARARGYRAKIELTVTVAPSGGIFRARLYRTAHQPRWSVDEGQVTRLDEYGGQSWCVTARHLKPFCLCRNSAPKQ